MRTNCINCGAGIEQQASKCPFCGTSYFDFTDIDLDSRQPIAVRMRANKHIVTFRAFAKTGQIRFSQDCIDVYDGYHGLVATIPARCEMETDITFVGIPREDGVMYSIRKETDI